VYPQSGNYMAILNTYEGSPASLSQTVATTPGQTYLLSCWVNGTSGGTPNYINIIWNGEKVLGQTNLGVNAWNQMLCFVVATGATSIVQFTFYDQSSWIALDDVSLQPVASPFFQPLTRTNGTLNFQWFAMTGLTYQVQCKTNLLQGAWVDLGSASAATNLLLNASDTIGTNRQRFYRIIASP